MEQLLLAVLVLLCFSSSYSNAQTRVTDPNQPTIRDDGWAEVPLQFVFPFYGSNFTTSWMLDNGVVTFTNPARNGLGGMCCNGLDLETMAQNGIDISNYSFMIAPLWTDLIDMQIDTDGDGQPDSGFFTQGTTSQMTYFWKSLSEYTWPNNTIRLNTFDLTIKDDGSYNINYDAIDIRDHAIAIGSAGDLTGVHNSNSLSSIAGVQNYYFANGYQNAILGILGDVNNYAGFCSANPLYDPSCPGYAAAYAQYLYNQQCSANPLYDSGCPGYTNAFYLQQCNIDPLYDIGCSGYSTAFDLECAADGLYSTSCTNYDQAVFTQECLFNPQFDSTCVGFIEETDVTDIVDVDDGEFNIFDVINETVDIDTINIPEPVVVETYEQEIDTNQMFGEESNLTDTATFVNDDIEIELEELETIQGEMNMEDNIEAELAALESEADNGETVEQEIAALEEEANDEEFNMEANNEEEEISESTADSTSEQDVDEERVQVANNNSGTDNVDKSDDRAEREDVRDQAANKKRKLKLLIANKANELTKKIEEAVTIEEQMLIQRQLLALISFVPGFDYNNKTTIDLANFYPDKPTVDHQYSRWFLNDPTFGTMENLQYPNLR